MAPLYVVTGGSYGLGLYASIELAKQGGTVIIAARNPSRLAEAVQRANTAGAGAGGSAVGLQLDLSSLADVKRFADELLAKYPGQKIQGLVLNAGIQASSFAWSKDGVESVWATNHLGHFYLAQLLLPHMSPDGRIVVTSSGTHDPAVKAPLPEPKYGSVDEVAMLRSDLNGAPPPKYNGGLAYTRSKLCNILFTYELARRLKSQGSGITVTAYDPGFCPDTDLARNTPKLVWRLMLLIIPLYMWAVKAPQKPSTAPVSGAFMARLAYDPQFAGVTGKYFSIDHDERSSPASYDESKQAELWEYSDKLVRQLTSQ